jgi:hypothetical protein
MSLSAFELSKKVVANMSIQVLFGDELGELS